jgi:hypothetical protein
MLNRIVTGDQSWVHHFQLKSKHAFIQWNHPSSPVAERVLRFTFNVQGYAECFWDCKVPCLSTFKSLVQLSVIATLYCCTLLWTLRDSICRKWHGLLRFTLLFLHNDARPHAACATQEQSGNSNGNLLITTPTLQPGPHPEWFSHLHSTDGKDFFWKYRGWAWGMAVVVTAADAALCIWFWEVGKMIGQVYSCFRVLCGKTNDLCC